MPLVLVVVIGELFLGEAATPAAERHDDNGI